MRSETFVESHDGIRESATERCILDYSRKRKVVKSKECDARRGRRW